eukprot:TRINITY_DN2303_c1_g1_i2.p2 TRINITY_DN2303_c1_g1~~TRINITY_DN2303_c1_g1_i2.p2  ORF type:complete len:333 (+),score=78.22 TRINITY_DN2303_c1_g1_i2:681-1679(+)
MAKQWEEYQQQQQQQGSAEVAQTDAAPAQPADEQATPEADMAKQWEEYQQQQGANDGSASTGADAAPVDAQGTDADMAKQWEQYQQQQGTSDSQQHSPTSASAEMQMQKQWDEFYKTQGDDAAAKELEAYMRAQREADSQSASAQAQDGGASNATSQQHSPTSASAEMQMQKQWDEFYKAQENEDTAGKQSKVQPLERPSDADMAKQWEEYMQAQALGTPAIPPEGTYQPQKVRHVETFTPLANLAPQPMTHSPLNPPTQGLGGGNKLTVPTMGKAASLASLPSGASTPTDCGPRSVASYVPQQPPAPAGGPTAFFSPKPGAFAQQPPQYPQ